ncbi:MAG: ABC transporter permease [Gemmatimonadaceae bacterium]|jgi:putative ABC transport system permease protein|nr:ABC transporter permease [Gemmatimonadaceae bacterium]MCC6244135.1 ABC transporter permease [Gemmatimonadaceae bacterium]
MRTALEAVGHNKVRAALTSLGILFGVASVIAMLAIGKGAEQEILSQMRLLGTNNIVITPVEEQKEGEVQDQKAATPRKFTPGLRYADAQAIAATIPNVDASTGEIVLNTMITREGRHRSAKLVGVDSSYFRIMNLGLDAGAPFTFDQVRNGLPVAVIGAGVKARFFTRDDPLGQTIKVGQNWLTVVGVLADRPVSGQNAQRLGIRDANLDVYIPAPTMLLRYRNRALVTQQEIEAASKQTVTVASEQPEEDPDVRAEKRNMNQLDRIIVRVDDAQYVPGVADVLQRMLARRHNTVVDFEVTVPELLLKQEQRTRTIFNFVLGAIASISLIVGGIGIMNIMLASILERIREIGVRRAMGATQRDILYQFLAEAVLISMAGGVAGILLGCAFSIAIERIAGITSIVSPMSVMVAFGVSCTVGLAFGIVPAHRAARQDPITCLRYE